MHDWGLPFARMDITETVDNLWIKFINRAGFMGLQPVQSHEPHTQKDQDLELNALQ